MSLLSNDTNSFHNFGYRRKTGGGDPLSIGVTDANAHNCKPVQRFASNRMHAHFMIAHGYKLQKSNTSDMG